MKPGKGMKAAIVALVLGLGAGGALAGDGGQVTLKANNAKVLTRALKFAGVKPARVKDRWTYKVASIQCHSAAENEDALGSYDCQLDKRKIVDAAALGLQDAMSAVGMPSDDHMSQTHVRAFNVTCVDDQAAQGGADAIYQCTYSASNEPAKK